jgi:energy-coupling factor transporter ATP-binding protein EcfA2
MIKLSRIVMVNWYSFGAKDIDIRGSAAIIGPNGAGKSSLLDAMQTVLTGNNRNYLSLNSSSTVATGKGREKKDGARSVRDYCLGNVDGKVLREACITYLALVFEREHDQKTWTIGIAIEARADETSEEVLGTFIAPDQSLRAADFLEDALGGGRTPVAFADLTTRLKRVPGFNNLGPRPTNFTKNVLQELRGRGGYADAERFLKTMKNALRFRGMESANDFIRGFILDDDKLDIESLRTSIATWRGFSEKIAQLEQQKIRLTEAIAQYRDIFVKQDEEKRNRWIARKAERERADYALKSLLAKSAAAEAEVEKFDVCVKRAQAGIQAILTEQADIKRALDTNNTELAIKRFQIDLGEAEKALEAAKFERLTFNMNVLAMAQTHDQLVEVYAGTERSESLAALKALGLRVREETVVNAKLIDELASNAVGPLKRYAAILTERRDAALGAQANLKVELQATRDQLRALITGRGLMRPATQGLIDTLKSHNISAEPLSTLVEVSDEDWRNAAETALGNAREALIVAPNDARKAIEILRANRKQFIGCQIVNTTKTNEISQTPEYDSLAAVIVTDNIHARAFINRRLNGIVRVATEEELLKVDRGITVDCISASGGSIEARRPAPNHLLGKDVQERNRPLIESQIAVIERSLLSESEKSSAMTELLETIKRTTSYVTASKGLLAAEDEVKACTERKITIEENIQTLESERPIEIRARLANLESDLVSLKEDEVEDARQLRVATYNAGGLRDKVTDRRLEFDKAEDEFRLVDAIPDHEREDAGREYAALLREFRDVSSVRNAANEAAARAGRQANALLGSAPLLAYSYAYEFKVDGYDKDATTGTQLLWLEQQYQMVEGNHLTQYKEKAERAKTAVEESLRSDLLVKLYTRLEAAKQQIRDLNATLRTKVFHRERYEFEIRPEPTYADIVQVARRVYENDADVMALFSDGAVIEGDIARGVARIHKLLESGEDVSAISDYRNYLRFELITRRVDTDEITSEFTTRQAAGSGGEKQVPYYIAISSAMAASYHHRETSRQHLGLGLALYDEAFNALDGVNTCACLALMEDFNLQVVACAPTEKLSSFMEAVETLISINREGTHCQIDVEYPTERGRARFKAANPGNVPLDLFRKTYSPEARDAAE